jgi:hypothetical protein
MSVPAASHLARLRMCLMPNSSACNAPFFAEDDADDCRKFSSGRGNTWTDASAV